VSTSGSVSVHPYKLAQIISIGIKRYALAAILSDRRKQIMPEADKLRKSFQGERDVRVAADKLRR
jgi:hypothetical protein